MTEKRYTYSELNNCQYSVDYTTFEEIYGEENIFHSRICEVNNKKQAQKVVDLLNKQEEELMMQREKALYWRNKAEDIWGDMKTNIELQKENKKLKERIKELEQFINKLSTDGSGRIWLANGYGYKVSAILTDYNGDNDD